MTTETENPRRRRYPEMETPPMGGETQHEAADRRQRNLDAVADWRIWVDARCTQCGMVRTHVTHETDPATAPEGADYYADFLDELHPFVGEEAS